MKTVNKKTIINIITFIIVLSVTFFFILPLLWQYIGSFKSGIDIVKTPPVFIFKPSVQSWVELQTYKQVIKNLRNSLIIVGVSIIINIILSIITGYSLARFKYKGRNVIGFLILILTMVPSVTLLIPIYTIMINLDLIGKHIAIIITYIVFALPFSIWIMRSFFVELPIEIEEAALIDGCTRFGVLVKIVVPISKPGIFATVVFSLMMLWGDFVFAGILGDKSSYTLPVIGAMTTGKFGAEWGQLAALTIVISIPMLIFALFTQKYLVQGLTMGAVKG